MTLQDVGRLDEESWPDNPPDEREARIEALIAELLDAAELDELPSLEPLVQDVLSLNTVTRVFGQSGSLKSFLVLSLAGAVGTGMEWYGKRVRQGLVIYLVAEGVEGMGKRKRAWEQHHGRKMTGVKFLPRPVQTMSPEWGVLIEVCRRLEPVLIIVDTQARVTVGVKENDNTEMGVVVDRMENLRAATGACVLIVHHTGHEATDRSRGASGVLGAMHTEIGVTRAGKGLDSKITLKMSKQKDDEELTDRTFTPKQINLVGEAKEDGSPVTSVVLVLGEPEGTAEADEIQMSPATRRILAVLQESGRPLSVLQIGDELAARQHPLKKRTIQNSLKILDGLGLAQDLSAPGGIPSWVTESGPEEASSAS